MADYNRKRENRYDPDYDRSRRPYGDYGGAYEQSHYGGRGNDSEWDRDEYRQGSIWEREHHLPGEREARRDQQGRRQGVGRALNPYDNEARRGSYQSYYDSRPAGRDRNDRAWWERGRDEVASWFGDDDAEHRRRLDEERTGGPHRGKGPKGYRRSEERIREDAYDRLTDDDYVDATDIQVQIEGDELVLTGTVHTRAEKRRAEDLVERVSGVRNVQNRLRVERGGDRSTAGY